MVKFASPNQCPAFALSRGRSLPERDAVDTQTQDAGGDAGLGDLADLLAHEGCADRGLQRNLAGLEVHLVRADYLEAHAGVCREIRELDAAQKAHPVLGEDVGADHAGMLQDLLQEADAADGLGLDAPRFAVSCIFAQVPLGTGLREVVLHLGVNLAHQMLQLG